MSFRSPATALQVTAALSGPVDLAAGAAVITDPFQSTLIISEQAVAYPGPGGRSFPAAANTTYNVANFSNLQVAFARAAGTAGWTVQFIWYADPVAAILLGTTTIQTPGSEGFYDSVPITGPYLRVIVTPTIVGAGQTATFRVLLRKGGGGTVGDNGDGLVFVGTDLGVPAASSTTVSQGGLINGGEATWTVTSTVKDWHALLYGIDAPGNLRRIGFIDSEGTKFGVSVGVHLPFMALGSQIGNRAATAGDFYSTVVAPTRRP